MAILTSCKECVFAIYEGKTQTSCKLNRLSLYGDALVEAYDNEREFYILKDKFCPAFRTKEWANKQSTDLESVVELEMQLKYHIIVFVSGEKYELNYLLKNIINQKPAPQMVTLIRKKDTIPSQDIIESCNTLMPLIPWTIREIKNHELTDNQLIDETLRIKQGAVPYYGVFESDKNIPEDLFETLSNKINNGFQFAIISQEDSIHGTIVPISIHRHLGGNFKTSLLSKIIESDCPRELIIDYKTL